MESAADSPCDLHTVRITSEKCFITNNSPIRGLFVRACACICVRSVIALFTAYFDSLVTHLALLTFVLCPLTWPKNISGNRRGLKVDSFKRPMKLEGLGVNRGKIKAWITEFGAYCVLFSINYERRVEKRNKLACPVCLPLTWFPVSVERFI